MSIVSGNIKKYREASKMTQAALARELGKSTAVVGNWESEINRPDVDCVRKMFEIFDIDANAFFGCEPGEITVEERAMLEQYRSLDSYGKEAVDGLLGVEFKRTEDTAPHIVES